MTKPLIGTTYSHRQIKYLKLNQQTSFNKLLNFGFDIVRFGCYWDEIEKQPGIYDFSIIKSLLDQCEKKNQQVVLTIGVKAPRFPEYYFPSWLESRNFSQITPYLINYIIQCIRVLKCYQCIKYWQVENEPLDPSGPEQLAIPLELLQKEVETIKEIDNERKIIINFWGNELSKRNLYKQTLSFCDVVGLDLYFKVPINKFIFSGPNDTDKKITTIINKLDKEVWITELQAEPWGFDFNQEIFNNNYSRALSLNAKAILFWGFEYWLWKNNYYYLDK